MRFWKKSPGHERALSSASTEIGVGVAGWRHGNQWYYVEIQMFLDTSCIVGAGPGLNNPVPNGIQEDYSCLERYLIREADLRTLEF
jgi:hypothetical protein